MKSLQIIRKHNYPKSIKFEKIYKLSSKINIEILCKLCKVSVSWYYKHRKLIQNKNTKEFRERIDLEIIGLMEKSGWLKSLNFAI